MTGHDTFGKERDDGCLAVERLADTLGDRPLLLSRRSAGLKARTPPKPQVEPIHADRHTYIYVSYSIGRSAVAYLEVGKVGDAEVVDAMHQDPGGEGRIVSRRRRRHADAETRSTTADEGDYMCDVSPAANPPTSKLLQQSD